MAIDIDKLAEAANRTAVARVLASWPELTLGQLEQVLDGPYGGIVASLTVGELAAAQPADRPMSTDRRRQLEQMVLQTIRARGATSSQYFCKALGLLRWEAQRLLASMAERGLLVRTGRTAGTRYSLGNTLGPLT